MPKIGYHTARQRLCLRRRNISVLCTPLMLFTSARYSLSWKDEPFTMNAMLKRLSLIVLLCALPAAAFADTGQDSQIQGNNSAASQLGPASSGVDSDSTDQGTSILQPADPQTLQSNNGSSGTLGGSATQTLQSPDTSSQNLQVLSDNADGGTHAPASPLSGTEWGALIAVLVCISGGASWLLYRSSTVTEDETAVLDLPAVAATDAETTDPTDVAPSEDGTVESSAATTAATDETDETANPEPEDSADTDQPL